ncbi:MAG TPA: peptidoglycan DD-metalloendopeptidase family protein [Solirubrobacteraceae bacterium]|nr:peptidoglycan DD-metalloendopeptidase family protein [Solirubrobacteraceae bacterium]
MLAVAALAPAAAAHAQSGAGGAASSPPPKLTSLQCRTTCSGPAYARAGSEVRLGGSALGDVRTVTFLGARGPGDDVAVAPVSASGRRVVVKVPRKARSGAVAVTNGDGVMSRPSASKLRIEKVATRRATSGPGPAIDVALSGRKVFFDGERRPTLTYVLRDDAPVHALVQVVRLADGAVVAEFDQGDVPPDEQRIVSWDGRVAGATAPDGRYAFTVVAHGRHGATATTAQAAPRSDAPPPESFVLLGHKFPVRGKHDYGGYSATFGGGRGHQGQDVFARCGTPLVAARGGTVKMKKFQSRAGHYVVIDTAGSGIDHAYMHLRDAAVVDHGDRVRTGQLIGYVGDTGRASGCHLHFEAWSAPGWYTGGSPFDPLPDLLAWDKSS